MNLCAFFAPSLRTLCAFFAVNLFGSALSRLGTSKKSKSDGVLDLVNVPYLK